MKLDLPIIISICALVLSILSPVLSAWISGHYRIKEKKLDLTAAKDKELHEIQVRHKMEVIEEYVRAVGELAKCDTTNREVAYGAVLARFICMWNKNTGRCLMKYRRQYGTKISTPFTTISLSFASSYPLIMQSVPITRQIHIRLISKQ